MSQLMQRGLGATGLRVSIVGLGAGHIGDPAMSEAEVAWLLHGALDAGVRLIDTARSYGLSEARIGAHLADRRDRFVLSTKLGYGIDGVADWTGPCVRAGIDAALERLRTDYLDIAHLHSCPRRVLERGDVIAALLDAVAAGKVRVAGYSGDNDDLALAVGTGAFGCVQTSVSLLDQWSSHHVLERAREAGIGVIAKRPLANAPWRFTAPPEAADVAEYWRRWRTLDLADIPLDRAELAIRFAAYHPHVHTALVGTRRLPHLLAAIEACGEGPLLPWWTRRLRGAVNAVDRDWRGVI